MHTDSLLGDGCRVMEGSVVKNSVLGSCAYIDQHCYIQVRPCGHGETAAGLLRMLPCQQQLS